MSAAPESVLPLAGQMVRLSRAGIALADAPAESLMGCPLLVARARPLTLSPPADAAPGVEPRHFIEMLAWRGGRPSRDGGLVSDAARVYTLSWVLYELRGETLGLALMADFLSIDTWPASALPADFDDRFELQMIRSGHVRWRFEAGPPQRGWIMLPEKNRQRGCRREREPGASRRKSGSMWTAPFSAPPVAAQPSFSIG